ncbi:hypothetical protein BpHYR1_017230 [Brachionus plicatilis]|uniref:Uncharacterized protein n=1 Tax=Brachionus plicatilis TaxID=10195 RepID=A0A3M7Q7K3_BRAPC|nr:hypothetical protein BpHYR1_017230 [Brachionus plicatilis]
MFVNKFCMCGNLLNFWAHGKISMDNQLLYYYQVLDIITHLTNKIHIFHLHIQKKIFSITKFFNNKKDLDNNLNLNGLKLFLKLLIIPESAKLRKITISLLPFAEIECKYNGVCLNRTRRDRFKHYRPLAFPRLPNHI